MLELLGFHLETRTAMPLGATAALVTRVATQPPHDNNRSEAAHLSYRRRTLACFCEAHGARRPPSAANTLF